MDVSTWMRPVEIFPDIAIVYGVAPWVVWKESTVVECVLSLYPHYPLPTLLARHENPKSQSGRGLGSSIMMRFSEPD